MKTGLSGNAQPPSNDLNASRGEVDFGFQTVMEGFHHVGVPDSELANSEGAGAANLQEFEYLLELALNSLQNSYFGGIFCPTYDIL